MALNLLFNNTESLQLLDWYKITENISKLSHFEKSKQVIITQLSPKESHVIQFHLDAIDKFLENFDDNSFIYNSHLRNIPSEIKHEENYKSLSKAKVFEYAELNYFGLCIENFGPLFKHFESFPFFHGFKFDQDELKDLRRNFLLELREFVHPSGSLILNKHPLLIKLHSELIQLEQELRNLIGQISKSELFQSKLQMSHFDIINDRYVLAIRSDSYQSVLGPIVSRSQSGQTLFVEPVETRELSNRRMQILSEIDAILLKLCTQLSQNLYKNQSSLFQMSDFLHQLDLLYTKASYSFKLGLVKPKISNDFSFEIEGIFHPLLERPVRNNISIKHEQLGFVISGPNTGGKTVTLKSVAICYLFLHLGLYVPARSARISPVSGLYFFSHDHQNLSLGLSSFASESKAYLELFSEFQESNLIIIDEIFNSTSSEEASALAIALFNEIHSKSNSKLIVSTHHQVLKTFIHANKNYVSSHVGYDFNTNQPTYKLIVGEPGSSLAFTIFEKLSSHFNIPNHIGENAKNLLNQKHVTYESLLQDLSHKKGELERLVLENRNLNSELKNKKASLDGVLFLEKEKALIDYQSQLKKILQKAENLFIEVQENKLNSKKSLQNKAFDIESELRSHQSNKFVTKEKIEKYEHLKPLIFEALKIGDIVFSLNLSKNVTISQINSRKKELLIKNGTVAVWVSVSTLRQCAHLPQKHTAVDFHISREVVGKIEVDCRGMRLEEFQTTMTKVFDEIISGEIPFANIIHGHGTGILKNWLRETIKNNKDLSFESLDGNDGCTKIFLS